jgi:hypothetical protein
MKNLLLGVLLALSASATAVTEHEDGSVTFTKEEADSMLENFQMMARDVDAALAIMHRMRQHIEELESRRCI